MTQAVRRKRPRKYKKREYYFDYTLLFIVVLLILFGLVVLYSTSSYEANMKFGKPYFYLKKQATATLLGVVPLVFFSKVDYHRWAKYATIVYIFSLISVCLVKTPLGRTFNGANRWINIAGISIQPAEIVKIAIILFLATFISKVGTDIEDAKSLVVVLVAAAIPAGMILFITTNMSSAIIVAGIAFSMVFVADENYKKYLVLFLGAIVAAASFVALTVINDQNGKAFLGFRGSRILAWINPEQYADHEGFQTLQALYAIGSGGFWGKGLGESVQKLGFLPEAQNDMVFSIICEELGLFGAICVIALFLMLIWRFMIVANNAPDLFGTLLVVGVLGHIAIQVILNIAVVTNTMPNTGITLPFISYGGTSIIFLMIEIGLVINVSSQIHLREV